MPGRLAHALSTSSPVAALQLTAMLLGGVLGVCALGALQSTGPRDFEEVALGSLTVSHFAEADGVPVHCRDLRDADLCLAGHARRGAPPVVLWLGNSQLHAVNGYAAGDETVALHLRRSLAAHGVDVIAFSQPNANLQEHLVLYMWLTERLPVRALVLPLVFDDIRETGVRSSLGRALQDPAVKARLQRLEVGARILATHRPRERRGSLAALDGTLQQPVEAAFVDWLDAHVPLWSQRSRIRSALSLGLFDLRNAVFGIDSSSVRRMVPGRQALNLAAAEALLRDARERGIATAVYLAPLRGDVAPRHVPAEYSAFRREAAELARRSGARFADLEDAIHVEAWGAGLDEEGAEVDVQHFSAEGHALLSRSVAELVRVALADAS